MAKIHFQNRNQHTESQRYWIWRDLKRQLQNLKQSNNEIQREFSRQAQNVRERIEFLVRFNPGGYEEALSALAEQDMTNFCLMVDLAAGVRLKEVEPLTKEHQQRLARFLAKEPWASLAVDNEISIALALLDSIGAPDSDTALARLPKGILDVLESVLENVNHEQYQRFLYELERLSVRNSLRLPREAARAFSAQLEHAAARLGVKPPDQITVRSLEHRSSLN